VCSWWALERAQTTSAMLTWCARQLCDAWLMDACVLLPSSCLAVASISSNLAAPSLCAQSALKVASVTASIQTLSCDSTPYPLGALPLSCN
jgi:hypothetical protein